MATFAEKQLLDRLFQAFTTDGSGNVALRTVASGTLSADSVNDTHIDWGTGANQVSAVDVPIEDAGGYFTTDNIEAALQQLAADAVTFGAPTNAKYIVQQSNATLTNEQALGDLATGILMNTMTTGVLSIAVEGTDYWKPGGTDVSVTDGGTGASTAAGARTNLGLVIGTNVQAWSAALDTWAGKTAPSGTVVGASDSQALSNKTLQDSTTSFVDDGDDTKAVKLQVSGVTTGTTRTLTVQDVSGTILVSGGTDVAVADGGTGASTAAGARTNLGLGTISTQDATNVTITGGSITNITDLAVADGGTGSSTASGARSNLGAAASGSNTDITALGGITAQAGIVLNPFNTSAGNTSEIRFLELVANGSSYVGFKAPDALAGNVIWTLPIADGSSGQTLTTNGSGVLSWATGGNYEKDLQTSTTASSANTAGTETVFNNHTFTIPANDLIAGVWYECEYTVDVTSITTSTIRMGIQVGGSSTAFGTMSNSTSTAGQFIMRGRVQGTAAAGASVAVHTSVEVTSFGNVTPVTGCYWVSTNLATNGTLTIVPSGCFGGSSSGSMVIKNSRYIRHSTTAS